MAYKDKDPASQPLHSLLLYDSGLQVSGFPGDDVNTIATALQSYLRNRDTCLSYEIGTVTKISEQSVHIISVF